MICINVIVKAQFPEMRVYISKKVSDELGGSRPCSKLIITVREGFPKEKKEVERRKRNRSKGTI